MISGTYSLTWRGREGGREGGRVGGREGGIIFEKIREMEWEGIYVIYVLYIGRILVYIYKI